MPSPPEFPQGGELRNAGGLSHALVLDHVSQSDADQMRTSLAQLFAKRIRPGWLLGPPGPSKEEVLEAVEKHTKKFRGPRQGWQVKAATWVKKVHMSRGHVEVGALHKGGKFVIDAALRPRYIVPNLEGTELRPYVAPYDEKAALKTASAKAQS